MSLLELNRNPSQRELKQFGAIAVPFLCALVGAWCARHGSWTPAGAAWGVGVVSLLVGLLEPRWLRPIFVGWMVAAYPIGWVVSHLLLAVIYFLVITPIGCLLRVMGRDPL